ncbi:MAG: TonB family protein [Verrucomicrobiales bacterium]|nr:TonB family protein [Verrucomicrobiales bacterium]
MNRLQKKCAIATAGFHLLLLVILFVGPAFFWSREKPDDTPVLDMIPANLIDAASTGVRGAQPPPPAPAVVPPTPTPPAPTPPAPTPTPEKVEPVKPPKETVKPDLTPVEKPSVTKPKINLVPTTRTVPKTASTSAKATPDNLKAIKSALQTLRSSLSSSTTIDMPGNSSAAAANYAQVVKSVYEQAWTPPDDTASDDANIKVRVTIASDGTVISARVIAPSGDASVDKSVRSTLERVQFIAPFPSGTSDKERSYIINFNLKSKRLLG